MLIAVEVCVRFDKISEVVNIRLRIRGRWWILVVAIRWILNGEMIHVLWGSRAVPNSLAEHKGQHIEQNATQL